MLFHVFQYQALDYFEDPTRAVVQIGDCDLDFAAVVETLPGWERTVYRMMGSTSTRLVEEVGAAYQSTQAYRSHGRSVRRRGGDCCTGKTDNGAG